LIVLERHQYVQEAEDHGTDIKVFVVCEGKKPVEENR